MTVHVFGRRLPATATYVVALGAALMLLVITVAGALWQTNQGVQLNEDVRQSLAQRSSLRLLLRGLQDAETGQRGYLLTGDESYLEPYLAGRADVEREIVNLEGFAGSAPARELPLLLDHADGDAPVDDVETARLLDHQA
ncbi:MAG: CHASE3 domain-containing protein, partial [Terricaulis sp.]